jgi:hypothetical protein
MTQECLFVRAALLSAGFKDYGYCTACPSRVRKYARGSFVIKTYGTRCALRLFKGNELIKNYVDYTKVNELIQAAV